MGRKGLSLEEAPVFHPTEDEFQNALRYIASIRAQAEPYGLCRIVPPASWQPPFALPEGWKFKTKVQKVHHLQERQGGFDSHTWRMEFERFLRKTGRVLAKWPLYCGEELDLCKLYNAVKRHGGLEGVTADRKWPAIARLVRDDGAVEQSPNAGAILRQLYQKFLLEYEVWERDPARHSHSERDSSSEEEEGHTDVKQAPRAGRKQESDALDAAEMDIAAAFLELGTAKGRQEQHCQACDGPGHEDKMILCDRCDSGWHIHCLSPPLAAVPPGNWYCPRCVTSEDAFGFEEGSDFTLEDFQKYANRFKRKWFGPERAKALQPAEIEAEFWRIVEQSKEPLEVLYGSDLDASVYGSGFPRMGHARSKADGGGPQWTAYAQSSWNLNNMPRDEASVLNRIDDQIPGVMVPWVYIGMLFSSFCWHYEDHCLYSINYCHWGEPKKWYGVPGSHAAQFEEVMQRSFPDMFAAQPDLLFQLVTMLNPAVLRKHGVPVYTTLQGPREFVITFPRSYHGGFNLGFNCAEAVNFAPADWLPWGGLGVERYRAYHRKAIISHDHLLRVVAKGLPPASKGPSGLAETRRWVAAELRRVLASERAQREALWREGTTASMRIPPHTKDDRIGEEEDPECLICKYYLHLSAVVCTCRPGKLACLKHAAELCECQQASERSLLYRYSLADLEDLLPAETEADAAPPSPKDLQRPSTPPPSDLSANAADDGPASTALRRRAIMRQSASGTGGELVPVKQEIKSKVGRRRSISHAEAAFSWSAQARSTLQQRPSLAQVAALLQEADEFLWGGHGVDSVREVVAQCVAVQEWAAELTAVVGSNARRVPLTRLQEVAAHISSAPSLAGHAHLVRALEERLRRATAMAAKMDLALAAKGEAALDTRQAQALLREAESVPAVLPQTAAMRKLLMAAQGWADEVRGVLGEGPVSRRRAAGALPDVDYLASLLKQGQRLAVRTSEVARLEALVVRVRAWQATARQLQPHIGPLKVLQACLREAEVLPVHVREMDVLAGRVLAAEEWQRRARKALAPEGTPQSDEATAPADRAARLRLLRGLLMEGSRLNLEMEELSLLETEIRRQSWLEGACRALVDPPSLQHLAHLVQEGDRSGVGGSVLAQLSSLSTLAADWEAQAGTLLSRRGSLDEVAALLRVAEGIPAKLPAMKQVAAAQATARAWGERAHPYLRSKQSRRHTKGPTTKAPLLQVSELEALVSESASLALSLKEADVLSARLVEVEAWRDKARSVLEAGAGAAEAVVAVLVADGEAMGLDLNPLMDQLQARAAAFEWERRAKQAISGRKELDAVAALLKEARGLPVDSALVASVQCAVDAGQSWSRSVSVLLQGGPRNRAPLEQLQALEEQGRALPVLLPELYHDLEHVLAQHRQWASSVERVVGDARQGTTTRHQLEQLLAEGESSIVDSPALSELRSAVGEAGEWEGQLRKALAKKGANLDVTAAALLDKVAAFLQAAVGRLRNDEDCPRLFCACQQEFKEAGNMIACDSCDEWYHIRCVGLTQALVAAIKKYTCPYCMALQSGNLPLETDVLSRLRSTRQPPLATLQDLHSAANALPCSLETAASLSSVIELAVEYQSVAQGILDSVTSADLTAHSPKHTPLLPLLKSVAVCEVGLPSLLPSVLSAMHAQTWRAKVGKALDGSAHPSPRALARLLKEAPASILEESGELLRRLQERDSEATAWLEKAKEVANDGGVAPVEEVRALIATGRALPLLLDKECQELEERCVLYCVCQTPYDEEKAMIACDRCERWFHYGCVGVEEPKAATGKRAGAEVEVELDFLCAACTDEVARKRAAAREKERKRQERKETEQLMLQLLEEAAEEAGATMGNGEERREAEGDGEAGEGGVGLAAVGAEEYSLLMVPSGLKRKRSEGARRARVFPLVLMEVKTEIEASDSGSSRAEGEERRGESEEGEERAGNRPARRTAGVNHKYANGYYVLS